MKVLLIHLIIVFVRIRNCFPTEEESTDKCLNRIYRECTHESTFTEDHIENVRKYLIKRFMKTRPIRKPCQRLRVRKDIKCLTKQEFEDYVDVIHQLHKEGFLDRMTKIHNDIWPEVHKYSVGLLWHRWFLNLFEEEMLKINPSVTLPYWNYFDDFAEPHKSIIWEMFGHSGTPENDFCVTDGPFANMTFKYPTPHCLRRQWMANGSMNPWEGPEWVTAINQMGIDFPLTIKELHALANWSTFETIPRNLKEGLGLFSTLDPMTKPWSQLSLGLAFVGHFKTHLSIGGLNGDMSISIAPNDPLFYVFHAMTNSALLSWQLTDDKYLVPHNYGLGLKYDFELHRTSVNNLKTDVMSIYTNISVKETFQIGFGELCYITDNFIEPINELIRGYRRPLPEVYHRLKNSLPFEIFALYYPKFAYYPQRVTFFDHFLTDVPKECNTRCVSTPIAPNFLNTPEGIRMWHRFKYDLDMDLTFIITALEKTYLRFMSYLNQYKYCSPYVF